MFSILQPHGRDRALRLAIAGWILLTFARAAGFTPAVALLDLIPFVRRIFFPVYIVPSWVFATLLLGALALDDWSTGRSPARAAPAFAALALTLAVVAASAPLAWPEIIRLLQHAPGYASIAAPACGLTLAVVLLAAILLARRTPARQGALYALLCLHAGCDFALPLLSAARPQPIDRDVIAFLHRHLGWQRFYAISVFAPNYAAFEGLGLGQPQLPAGAAELGRLPARPSQPRPRRREFLRHHRAAARLRPDR